MNKTLHSLQHLLVILVLLFPFASAEADIAPPPTPGLGGLSPIEYQSTNVQMVYERVEMEIQNLLDSELNRYTGQVAVDALFVMRNLGDEEEQMRVSYPVDNFNECRQFIEGRDLPPPSYTYPRYAQDSFSAYVDGNSAQLTYKVTAHPYQGQGGCDQMHWISFEASFPVDQDVLIHITYRMEEGALDSIQSMEYILETGAAWKGPINKGDIVFRFPHIVGDNLLEGTTSGYKKQGNELHWSFENLEPTAENNIVISYVTPETWLKIQESLDRTLKDATDAEAWLTLARSYRHAAYWHGTQLRLWDYREKAFQAYQEGIAHNPDNADLYAELAELTYDDCCFHFKGSDQSIEKILDLLDHALQIDPAHQQALSLLEILKMSNPGIEYVPPATFAPTANVKTTRNSQTQTPRGVLTTTPRATNTPWWKLVTRTATPSQATATKTALPEFRPVKRDSNVISRFGWLGLSLIAAFSATMLFLRKKK